MAEESVKNLTGFVQQYLDPLDKKEISIEDAHKILQEMYTYKDLREILQQDETKIRMSQMLADGEDIRTILAGILHNVSYVEKKEQTPDEVRSPAEIAARAQALQEAQEQIPQTSQQRFEQERKTYARRVARKWIENTKANIQEQELILQTAENIPPTTSVEETRRVVTAQLQDLTKQVPTLARGQAALQQIAQTTELTEPTQIQQQITKAILDNPEADQPMLLGLSAQGVDFQRAAQLANLGKVFSAEIDPTITLPIADNSGRPVFFRAVATTPLQKLVAPVADAFSNVQVVETVLTKSWERVASPQGLQKLEEKFGAAVVGSPAFRDLLNQGNRAFGEKPAPAGGAAAGLSKFIGDALGTVFGTGVDQAMVEKYLELHKAPTETITHITVTQHITWRHFYAAFAHAHEPSLFSFAFDGVKWILGTGGKKLAGAAAKKVAGIVAKGAITKTTGASIGAAVGSLIPIPIVGTVVGAVVGFLVSFVGGKILGGLWRGAKFLLGGFFTRLMSGDTSNLSTPETIMAAVILAPLILISIVPWFGNPHYINHAGESFALSDSEGGTFAEMASSDLPLSISATGSCPVEGGQVATGSLNRAADTGHGSSSYWGGRTPSYPIPVAAMTPNCGRLSCPYYGFAIDVVSPSGPGAPVHVPKICPTGVSPCQDLTWTVINGWFNCAGQSVPGPSFCSSSSSWGYGYIFTANGNGHTWQIYLNHLAPITGIRIGSVFNSGGNNVVGSLATTLSHPHVHIEINVDGVPVKPESLMCR